MQSIKVWSWSHQTKSVSSVHPLRPQGTLVGDPVTAKLTTSDREEDNGCITPNNLEWIRIRMNTGELFSCPLGGFLDNGPNPAGSRSRTVGCHVLGE